MAQLYTIEAAAMTDSSGQIASQTLRAALGIRELAFSGAVAPGERLSEVGLSERLGLSRTPIRAASRSGA